MSVRIHLTRVTCHAQAFISHEVPSETSRLQVLPHLLLALHASSALPPFLPIILMRSLVTFPSIKFLIHRGMRLLTFLCRCLPSEPLLQLRGESCSSQVFLFLQHVEVNGARKDCSVFKLKSSSCAAKLTFSLRVSCSCRLFATQLQSASVFCFGFLFFFRSP